MTNRELYMNKLCAYKDTEFIKVITGIRRCGKSSLLKLLMNRLLDENEKNNVIYMNFEFRKGLQKEDLIKQGRRIYALRR